MVGRKAKAVRNNPNRWDYYDSQKLDYYRAHLELLIQNKKNGEDYYIKF
jgi:Holliday junction resolvase RusA-like endonuclease